MEVIDPFNLKFESTFQDFFHYFGKSFVYTNFMCYRTFNNQVNDVISNVYVFNSDQIKKFKLLSDGDFFDLTKAEDLKRFLDVTERMKNHFLKNIKKNNSNLDNTVDFFT